VRLAQFEHTVKFEDTKMPAGRPPKPTAIKELEGNPGKRKLNRDEPKFTTLSEELLCPTRLGILMFLRCPRD